MVNETLRAGSKGTLSEQEASICGAAAQAIFDLFGLEEVSSRTRNAVERWHRRTYANVRWSTVPQGFLVGAVCPEFQVY